MSLLTRIVKAHAVVDDRTQTPLPFQQEPVLNASPVLKKNVVLQSMPLGPAQPLTIDAYQDELNRIRVQIKESQEEFSALTRQLNEIREELGAAQSILQIEVNDADARTQLMHDLQAQARAESEQILSQAQADCEAIREEARIQGFKEGYTAGMEQAVGQFQQENEPKAKLLGELIERLTNFSRLQVEENEGQLVNLVTAVAQKVLHKELAQEPGALANLLYDIVDENRREAYIKVFLAKDLLPVEARASQEVRDMITALGANVSVVSDDSIEPGSVIVETPKGITDVSIHTQMENIGAVLKEG